MIFQSLFAFYFFRFEYYSSACEQLMKIIESKSSGKEVKVEKVKSEPTAAKDLMAKLKASLEQRKKKAS